MKIEQTPLNIELITKLTRYCNLSQFFLNTKSQIEAEIVLCEIFTLISIFKIDNDLISDIFQKIGNKEGEKIAVKKDKEMYFLYGSIFFRTTIYFSFK